MKRRSLTQVRRLGPRLGEAEGSPCPHHSELKSTLEQPGTPRITHHLEELGVQQDHQRAEREEDALMAGSSTGEDVRVWPHLSSVPAQGASPNCASVHPTAHLFPMLTAVTLGSGSGRWRPRPKAAVGAWACRTGPSPSPHPTAAVGAPG